MKATLMELNTLKTLTPNALSLNFESPKPHNPKALSPKFRKP